MDSSKAVRKACDFCYLRKIKCDGQRPACSTCSSYSRKCTYGAPSRQYKPRNRRDTARIESSNDDLRNRVQQLESLVKQLSDSSQSDSSPSERSQPHGSSQISTDTLPLQLRSEGGSVGRSDLSPTSLDLPSKQVVMPLVYTFLEKLNAILPLFNPEALRRLVHDTYKRSPKNRDTVAWAAINVVLALTYRQGLMGSSYTHRAVEYVNKAQSVLSDVVLGSTELLNIQVLVGLVMLLEGAEDLQPALILVGTTMRLAHGIGLHNRAWSAHLDYSTARERANVFWIAYILDKDLSLRTKQPSIQIDDDIDLELPGSKFNHTQVDATAAVSHDGDGAGIITTIDGTAQIEYFVSRVQLAVVEGGVYDYLFSTRAQKRTPVERIHALESVSRALQQWKASIPAEFQGVGVLDRAPPDTIRFICVLQATSMLCTTCINQAHAMNVQWVGSLCKYGRDGTVPALPPQWDSLVDEARTVMTLFEHSACVDRWNWWITGCSYLTAMVLLSANIMHKPQHDNAYVDEQLISNGLQVMEDIVEDTDSDKMRAFQDTCIELHDLAQRSRGQAMFLASDHDLFAQTDGYWPHEGF